jgi:hypothetical protein
MEVAVAFGNQNVSNSYLYGEELATQLLDFWVFQKVPCPIVSQ